MNFLPILAKNQVNEEIIIGDTKPGIPLPYSVNPIVTRDNRT